MANGTMFRFFKSISPSGWSRVERECLLSVRGAILPVVAVLLFLMPTAVLATDSRNGPAEPFHIGTFQTRPADQTSEPVAPAVRADAKDKRARGSEQEVVQSAPALLALALEDLKTQNLKQARRRFELLVVRYPDSLESQTARGHLRRLYAGVVPLEKRDERSGSGAPVETATIERGSISGGGDVVGISRSPHVNDGLSRSLGLAVGDRVFFAPGSDRLGLKAAKILNGQAAWLSRRRGLSVLISGYADEPGGNEVNYTLSQRRALSVKQRLIQEGVGEDRIQIIGFGRTSPIAKCSTGACAAQNRRAVTLILQGPSSHAGLKVKVRKAE